MKLDTQAFLNSLVFMGEGMLGIFRGDADYHRRDLCARPLYGGARGIKNLTRP